MSLKLVTLLALLSLICPPPAYSQNCQECKTRRIIMYDNEVDVSRPSGPADSIYRYWAYYQIVGGVRDYMMNLDPTRDCITKLDGAFFTARDTVTSNITFGIEHANLPPPGEAVGFTDYLIYGVVSGDQTQTFTLKLEAGKTRESVKTGTTALPKGFDPFEIGRTVAALIGPMYTTIMDFEKRKRDEGEPYAIQPKIILVPGKAKLHINEKTNIDVLFKDCDGVPLKKRNLTLSAGGGTLKNAVVTTDDQGRATVEFTAGPVPALANVTSTYPFQKPTGYMDVADVEAASIQIDKPNDSWYVQATYQISQTITDEQESDLLGVGSGSDKYWTDIALSAWVRNISPFPVFFISDPQNFQIKYSASYGRFLYTQSHWENEAACVDDRSHLTENAVATGNPDVEFEFTVQNDNFMFNIDNIVAAQNGTGQSIRVTYDILSGKKTTVGDSKVEPQKILGFSLDEPTKDTTYTTTDMSEGAGVRTTKITNITRKASWKNNIFNVSYKRIYSEDTKLDLPGTNDSREDETCTISIYMSYTGDPPTRIESEQQTTPAVFALNQNHPNPFNPSTVISYVLPKSTRVTLMISDILGRKITTLIDDEKAAGTHMLTWNAAGLPSGVYFLQMRAGGFVETRKLLLAK
jgi:hypothetical protein